MTSWRYLSQEVQKSVHYLPEKSDELRARDNCTKLTKGINARRPKRFRFHQAWLIYRPLETGEESWNRRTWNSLARKNLRRKSVHGKLNYHAMWKGEYPALERKAKALDLAIDDTSGRDKKLTYTAVDWGRNIKDVHYMKEVADVSYWYWIHSIHSALQLRTPDLCHHHQP